MTAAVIGFATNLGRNNSPKTANTIETQQRSPTSVTSQKTGMFQVGGGLPAEKNGARAAMFSNPKAQTSNYASNPSRNTTAGL